MPEFVQYIIILSLFRSVFSRMNYSPHPRRRLFHNCIRIITEVSKQELCINFLDQLFSFCTIRCGTFCNKYSDRHTMRIHGQMYLGVEPSFVTAIS